MQIGRWRQLLHRLSHSQQFKSPGLGTALGYSTTSLALAFIVKRPHLLSNIAIYRCRPEIIKVALTTDDVGRYNLPRNLTKTAERNGNVSAEIESLPAPILRDRTLHEVKARMNLDFLAAERAVEFLERERLVSALRDVS